MKRIWNIALSSAVLLPTTLNADDELLGTFKSLKPEIALEVAQAAMAACRGEGFQVSVAVVDRAGGVQVMLRDEVAGQHTVETARRKAWTAASFKADTAAIAKATQADSEESGARFVPEAIMVGGGVPLYAEGSIVGAVGVSGSPRADADQKCAQKGAQALEERLLF